MQQGNMWQVTLEVFSIAFAVLWMVQHSVGVVKNIPLRHFGAVFCLELGKRPIGDVLTAIAAVIRGVNVKWEALCSLKCQIQLRNYICSKTTKFLSISKPCNTNHPV